MKDLFLQYRKSIFVGGLFFTICLGVLFFVKNDYFLYDGIIAKIISVEDIYDSTEENTLGFQEQYYNQEMKAKIMNGKNKGNEIILSNLYASSLVYDNVYKVGDEVFVLEFGSAYTIDGVKRDTYLVFVLLVLLCSVVFVGHWKGLFSFFSLLCNTFLVYVYILLYLRGISIFPLTLGLMICFSSISLLFVSGFNKKTVSAILSALIGSIAMIVIALLVIHFTNYQGVSFEYLDFLTIPIHDLFLAELFIGGLGAIMDISITMSSSFQELIDKNNEISNKALKQSGIEIGKDIMGTMVNVLFFTYVCGAIPSLILYLRNGITLTNALGMNLSLELTRFLVGSIGIVITIPISIVVSIFVLRRHEA